MERSPSRKGQSLVEVLVGIALGTIFIVGAVSLIAPALRSNKQVQQVQTRAQLAKELSDNVRAWAANNWSSMIALSTGTANSYYLSATTSSFSIVGSSSIINSSTPQTIAFVQTTSTAPVGTNASLNKKFLTNPVAGDLIVAFGGWGSLSGDMTCSDTATNVYTTSTVIHDLVNHQSQQVCWAIAKSGVSSDTVTVTFPSALSFTAMGIHEYSGVTTTTSPLDVQTIASGTASGNGTDAVTSGNIVTTQDGDLIFGLGQNDGVVAAITAGTGFASRQSSASYAFLTEDKVQSSAGTTAVTFTWPSATTYLVNAIAFKPSLVITTTTVQSGGGAESLTLGSTTYSRYFYVNDVFRDSSGNVTTTISGNYYDPSTKQITIVIGTPSSTNGTTTFSLILTRNSTNLVNQTDWLGGSGQNTAVTYVSGTYASAVGINVNATGSIQLTGSGGVCLL